MDIEIQRLKDQWTELFVSPSNLKPKTHVTTSRPLLNCSRVMVSHFIDLVISAPTCRKTETFYGSLSRKHFHIFWIFRPCHGLIWTFLFRLSVVILLWVCRFCFCFCLVSFVFGRFLQTQGKTHLKQESFCAGNSRHVRYKYIYWEIHQNKHSGIWTWQRNQTGTNEKSELNPGEGHQCGPVIRTETNQTMALSNCPGPLEWASIFSLDFNKTGFILLVSEERHKLRSPNIIWYSIWYITPVMSNGLHVTWFRLCGHYATFIGCSQRRLHNVITLRVTAKQ